MQHQLGIGAEQTRRINPQRQVGSDAGLAIVIDRGLGVAFGPGGLHAAWRACAMRQSLSPSRRLPHQPRFGAAVSGAVLEITGVGGGSVGDGEGAAPAVPIGAGSRMVERRRGGSCAGSCAATCAASCRIASRRGGRRLVSRRRIARRAVEIGRRLVEIGNRALQFRLRRRLVRIERRVAVAMFVAASATAAAPAAAAAFRIGALAIGGCALGDAAACSAPNSSGVAPS